MAENKTFFILILAELCVFVIILMVIVTGNIKFVKIQIASQLMREYRFSAFWLRSKCSICSYQLNIWYEDHVFSPILNSFLIRDGLSEACFGSVTSWPCIAVPQGSAHFPYTWSISSNLKLSTYFSQLTWVIIAMLTYITLSRVFNNWHVPCLAFLKKAENGKCSKLGEGAFMCLWKQTTRAGFFVTF